MAGAPPILGGGGPPFPAPPLVTPGATSLSTFKRAVLALPSPYGQDYVPMCQYWSSDAANTPAQLSAKAVGSRVQWFLTFHQGIQSYLVLHDPFIYPAAPGLNHPRSNQIIWVMNDVGTTDATLSLVDQPNNMFHVTTALPVPPDDEFTALMMAAPMAIVRWHKWLIQPLLAG
jgi:hypothetical protein